MARVKEMCDLFHHVFDWSALFLFPLRERKKDKKKCRQCWVFLMAIWQLFSLQWGGQAGGKLKCGVNRQKEMAAGALTAEVSR